MVVEPAVADSITGKNWNKYVLEQEEALRKMQLQEQLQLQKDVKIATFAPDNAFGREGIAAFKAGAKKLGANIVNEQYADTNSTDFTANIQNIISSKPDYLFIVWAGANSPWKQLKDMNVEAQGIKISTGAPDIPALKRWMR